MRQSPGPGVLINAGFSEADISEMGPTVLVTHDEGRAARAGEIARGLAQVIWDQRGSVSNDFLTPEAAAVEAVGFDAGRGPLVIADYADNPGAGAYGDATALLAALLKAGATGGAFAPMIDPGRRRSCTGTGWGRLSRSTSAASATRPSVAGRCG